MRRSHTFITVTALIAITTTVPAYAQWWRLGPKNFDECVLEKMKGQVPGMIQYARKACREQFPEEELFARGEDYDVTWCDKTNDSISACLALKGDHKVLRAEALFSKQDCDVPNTEFDVVVSTDPPLWGSTFKFKVADARDFKCADFRFFGHRKK